MPPEIDVPEGSLQLHKRLLAGDLTASAQLAELHLPRLIVRLKASFRNVEDDHLVEMAAHDAMMNYLSAPEKYDPSKLPLDSYLRMSAQGDLLNHLRKQGARSDLSKFGRIVELDAFGVEQEIPDSSMPNIDEYALDHTSPVWGHLAELLPDPIDQEIVLLMMDNVRATEEYATLLGISHLPPDEQAREVKRNKDRLKKRLQRHLRRSAIEQDD